MEQKEKMHTGELYLPTDKDILKEQLECLEKLYDYNATRPSESEKRVVLLKDMFAEIGDGCYIEPPLHASWGGKQVHFGHNVYANFHLTLVDDTAIHVGDNVMFGPNVTLTTGTHPIHPALRRKQVQYNLPITIGNNVWIGANSVVLPGVKIGDNSVIGAGSVVTRDIPSGVVAAGNPCRVLRELAPEELPHKKW